MKSQRKGACLKGFSLLVCLVLLASLLAGSLTGCSFSLPRGSAQDSPANNAGENSGDSSTQTQGQPGQPSQPGKMAEVKEGAYAPDFEFITMDGTTAKLSDYQGQVILLNFWATWCGYCIEEMPDMQRIAEDYPDVVILAINRSDDSALAIEFANEKGYDFIWGLDEDGSIARLYPSNGIPYSLIIDREGIIGTIYEGSAPDMYHYFKVALVAAGL